MAEVLKQLFSNDKADEIIYALSALSGVDATEYAKSIGICLLDVLEDAAWCSSNAEAKIAALREAIYNPDQSHVLPPGYVKHDYVYKARGTVTTMAPLINIKQYPRIYEKGIDITFGSTATAVSAVLGARLRSSQVTDNSQSFAFYQNGSVIFMHIFGSQSQSISGIVSGKNVMKYRPQSGGATFALNDGTPLNITGAYSVDLNLPGLSLSANPCYYTDQSQSDNPSVNSGTNIGNIKIYDGNTVIGNYVPCLRVADSLIGLYDTIEKVFYTANTPSFATVGNSDCIYALGDW